MGGVGRRWAATAGLSGALAVVGCGSKQAASPNDRVFYQGSDFVGSAAGTSVEASYPPLDAPATPELPGFDGVSLFDSQLHLSRPHSWIVRLAGGTNGRRYVEYDSPHAYLFAVYELSNSLGDWDDVLGDYEDAAAKSGAELLSKRVPMATANAQGLGYFVRRTVTGSKGPLVNYSHEYVIRGSHRILLAQIVHHSVEVDGVGPELRRVLETLELQ